MNDPSPLQKNPKGQDELSEQQEGVRKARQAGWLTTQSSYLLTVHEKL